MFRLKKEWLRHLRHLKVKCRKIHGYATDTTTYVDTTAVNGRTYKYTICCVDENKKQISGIDKINVMTVVVKR